jgi:TP901 family phage tail tape measure protein
MAINIPANVQIQNANQAATYLQGVLQGAVNNVQFNLGGAGGSRTLRSLSQPLGRLTGQADEFTKSLDAANARVLAFGASVGIVNAVSNAFKSLVNSTIEVEKAITAISVVGDQFSGKTKELSQGLFNVAKVTGQSFNDVSKAALEFSRQGLSLEDTLSRTQDALVLTRLTGLDAAKAVDGLTASVNGFSKAGLSTTQILNKLAAVDQAFAVSAADLIEGFNRSAAVAQNAGVSFDELAGIITALQQETSRGGAVIGNALKTIFTRLQDTSTLNQLQNLGVAVQDLQGNILPARQILQNLAKDVEGLGQITKAGIFKDVAGTFQINQLIALVSDLNKENSIAAAATRKAAGATNEAFVANEKLNQSLDAILNKVATTGKQLGSLLGEIGLSDNLKGLLDGLNSFLESANSLLQGDDIGSNFAKGFVKGIGAVLSGPGLGVFLAIIAKLSFDLLKFGAQSLKTFFGIGKAAADQKQIQESIVQTLLRNQNVLNSIVTTQGGQNAQALKFLGILNQQATAMQAIQVLSSGLAPAVYSAGYRQTGQGLQRRSAGGYLPAQEAADVRRGVGGASPSSKVVAIPNFAFGGGKRGTMIANTSEYIVPNYAGGGSAIFNQDMVKSMGLPAGAKKISAAGGFIPNFADATFNIGSRKQNNNNNDLITSIRLQNLRNSAYVTLGSGEQQPIGRFGDMQSTAQDILQSQLGPISPSAKVIGEKIEFIKANKDYSSGGALVKEIEDLRKTQKSNGKIPNLKAVLQSIAEKIIPQTGGSFDESLRKQLQGEIYSNQAAKFSAGNILEQVLIKTLTGKIAPKNSKTWDLPSSISGAFKNRFGIKKSSFGDIKLGISPSSVSSFLGKHVINPDGTNASSGYIPNFAATNKDLAVFGLYGRNNGEINGSPVYTLQGQSANLTKNIEKEYRARIKSFVRGYSQELANQIGIKRTPREVVKSLQQTSQVSGFIFEDVLNQLAGPEFDSNRISGGARADFPVTPNLRKVFGATGTQPYAEVKLDPYTADSISSIKAKQAALAAGALGPKSIPKDEFNQLRARAIELGIGKAGRPSARRTEASVATQAEKNAFIKELISAGIIKSDFGSSSNQSKAIKRALGMASGGYVPNFAAAALQQAIAREKSAGLSDSQIYVDQNAALKSPMNPMGLMVANRRDEPAGGFQGIARARKEGVNPKLYGAAGGFVPNLAAPTGTSPNIDKVEKGFGDLAGKFIILQSALSFFEGGFTEAGSVANKFSSALQTAVSAVFAYQAIQQLSSKNQNQQIQTNTSLLKKASDGLKKFASDFGKGGGARAATVARGGKLPSSTPFATRFSAGLGTGKIAGGVRSFVGNPLGAIQSLGATALTATIALKSFNDIASLFYTKSPKVASSLELLSSAASKATTSLNDVDRSNLTGVQSFVGSTRNTGELASDFFLNLANSLDITSLGRDMVGIRKYNTVRPKPETITTAQKMMEEGKLAYKDYFKLVQASNLPESSLEQFRIKGGQSKEDFAQARKSLIDLVFADVKSKKPNIGNSEIQKQVDETVNNLLAQAVSGGEIDLSKLKDNPIIQNYIKNAEEVSKKIQIATSNAEFDKPVQLFKRALEKIISDGGLVVENAARELERQSKLISAISSSKSFASLSDSSKLVFEIDSSSRQLAKELENRVAKFGNDTQSGLLNFVPELGLSEDVGKSLTGSFEKLGQAKTQNDIESNLNSFSDAVQKAGALVEKSQFDKLQAKIKELTNSFQNLQKETEVEKAVLALNNSEKVLEARSFDFYRKNLAGFVNEMIAGQTKLIQMRGDLDRIDVKKQGDIEIATANARSSREAMLLRQDIESKAFQEKQPTEQKILLQEKELAAKREFFTKDNIAGLNRNTEALNNLTRLFASDFINKIDAAIAEALRLDYIDTAYGQTASKKYKEMSGLGLPSEMTAPEALKYFQELKGVYSPSASLPMASSGGNLQTADKYLEKIGSSVAGGSDASAIQAQIENFGVTPEMKLRFTEYANQLLEAYKTSYAAFDDKLKTLKAQQETEKDIFDLQNSYAIKLKAQIRALNDSLTDPQTAGEYASKLRQRARDATEVGKGSDAERRAYRSSFGYGLDQGLEELEKRTLDYKQELGVEIPRLFSSNLSQGLNDAISGAKDLKTALTDAATSFFQEISRKNISNLADMVTGGTGNFIQSLFKPSIPKALPVNEFASGGFIKGGSGTKDDVPAMLMGGEYVMKKSAVNKYGKGFLDALNNGKMRGYATGGLVDPETFPTQTGRSGFFTPGDYGQGAITGKNELLTFATQSFTGGQYDYMGGFGMGGASVGLESESARLSAFGRENSPMFDRVQQSKDEAFRVYLDGLQKEKEYAELLEQIAQEKKARKKQLKSSFISALVTSALSYGGNVFATGAKNATAASLAAGGKGGFLSGVKGGFSNLRNFFSPSSALKLSPTAQLLKEVGVSSYKDLYSGKAGLEGYTKILKSNSNFGKKTNFPIVEPVLPSKVGPEPMTNTLLPPVSRASGGLISGGSNIKDDVPAMLTGGEFVLNNRATQRIGLQNLNKLNSGQPVSGEGASAEMTQALISKLDELIQATQNSSSENVVVNVSTSEAGGQNQENSTATEKDLGKKIRQAVLDVIAQEKRLGGSLEKAR